MATHCRVYGLHQLISYLRILPTQLHMKCYRLYMHQGKHCWCMIT